MSDKLLRDIEYRAAILAVAIMPHLRSACPHDKYRAITELPGELAEEIKAIFAHLIEMGDIREVGG